MQQLDNTSKYVRGTYTILMTTYNGEQFIEKQLESILKNMSLLDELIISDDNSSDNTIIILEEFIKKNKNRKIKLLSGPNSGLIKNYIFLLQYAKKHSKNDFIVLCDQDDIWALNKLDAVDSYLHQQNIHLVLHDAYIIDEFNNIINNSFFKLRNSKQGIIKNIIKNSYIGCCMAFKKECLDYLLPIPYSIPMHDQWIGLMCEINGNVKFLNEKLIYYRRHSSNSSSLTGLPIKNKLKNRIILIKNLLRRAL